MERSRSRPLALLLCTASVVGCAQGGRGPTPGGPRDGGRDASALPSDGGDTLDGGPAGTDSGADAGRDSGPTLRLDAGPDSGAPDAGCTSAAECDDGLVCNGVERCEGGHCTSGTAVVCDDGITCTVDRCVEPAASCDYVPDDSLCGAGESCSAATGCMAGCAESPCRLVAPQCGCPSGQGCYVDAAGGRSCSAAGSNAEGAPCTAPTSCTAGNLCINIDSGGGSTPVCAHFCSLDSQCGGGLCVITLSDGSGGSIPGVTLCTRACDPVAQTGCRTGAYCDIFQESAGSMRYFTDCAAPSVGSGTQGASCADADDCAAGYACLDPGTGDQCVHWCRVGDGTGCSGLTTCVGFTSPVTIGGTEYGVCV